MRLDALAPHDIQRFINMMKTSGAHIPRRDSSGKIIKKNGNTVYDPGPLSAKTVKDIHGVLHSALQQAQRNGYIRYNPSEACVLPRAEKHKLKPLDEKETSAFLWEQKILSRKNRTNWYLAETRCIKGFGAC